MSVRSITGEAHFFEENLNIERIKKLLDNRLGTAGMSEKLEGMKYLLAMMSKGQDVSIFFPDVVKNVIVSSVELKKLVYMYLVHYADHDAQCRELALLSINSFQKDLADNNQLVRAMALRVMTSIRVADIIQIQIIAVKKCASDSSPYVRKTAANALCKIHNMDKAGENQTGLADIIGRLLNDGSTMVLSSAVQTLSEVCPHRLDLLHIPYRKLCHLIADLDEWGQIALLNLMTRYCRTFFVNPNPFAAPTKTPSSRLEQPPTSDMKKKGKKAKKAFYSDEEDSDSDSTPAPTPAVVSRGSVFAGIGVTSGVGGSEEVDQDHKLILRCSLPLLKSRNSGVVLAVTTLHWYCGTQSAATSALLGKSLVRILRNRKEVQYVVLSAIASMSAEQPDIFRPFLQDFYVKATDPQYLRTLKLEILTNLASSETVTAILKEMQTYVCHGDKNFIKATVKAVGAIADAFPSVSDNCLFGLMQLVGSSNELVAAESVIIIRQLLQQKPNRENVSDVVQRLARMLSTLKSPSARASVIWILGEFRVLNKKAYPDALRILAIGFPDESSEVKLQIVNLGVKLALSEPNSKPIQLLLQYLFELATYDVDYDIRDRARFLKALLLSDKPGGFVKKVLLAQKPAPLVHSENGPRFIFSTLSDMVHHSCAGYVELPDWPSKPVDPGARNASFYAQENARTSRDDPKVATKSKQLTTGTSFYSSHSSSGSENGGSESDDEEDSSEDGSSQDVESDSNLSSSSSPRRTETKKMGQPARSSTSKARRKADLSSDSGSDADTSESESSSSSHSSDSEEEKPKHKIVAQAAESNDLVSFLSPLAAASKASHPVDALLTMPPASAMSANNNVSLDPFDFLSGSMVPTSTAPFSGSDLLMSDFNGLAITDGLPVPAAGSISSARPLFDVPVKSLLSPDTGKGLQVDYYFTRQKSALSPTMVQIVLRIGNFGHGPVEQIGCQAREELSVTIVPFPVIISLAEGATTDVMLQVDFKGMSKVAPLNITTSKDNFPVSILPSAGELVIPEQLTLPEFIAKLSKVEESRFRRSVEFALDKPAETFSMVPKIIKEAANMTEIVDHSRTGMYAVSGKCRFAAKTLHDKELLLISVEISAKTGQGKIIINSKSTLFAEQLMHDLKHALSQ